MSTTRVGLSRNLLCVALVIVCTATASAVTIDIMQPADGAAFPRCSQALFSAHVENLGDNDWNAWWEFHDTHETAGQTTIPEEGEADVETSHAFNHVGPFIADVTVVDFAGDAVETASVQFVVADVSIESIEFTSDHGVMKDGGLVGGGGTLLPSPEWVPGVRNVAISQTMGTPLSVAVTVTVTPANVPFTLTGGGGSPEAQFSIQGTSTGASQTVAGTAAGSLPNEVGRVTVTIPWTLEVGGVSSGASTDSGPHTVFITYGLPRGDVTLPRVLHVTNVCENMTDPHQCVAALKDLADTLLDPGAQDPAGYWSLANGTVPAQCWHIACFCYLAARQLGCGAGEVIWCYPLPGGESAERTEPAQDLPHERSARDGHDDKHKHHLYCEDEMLIYKDARGRDNAFEACFRADFGGLRRYHAPGARTYASHQEVIDNVADYTYWRYVDIALGEIVLKPCGFVYGDDQDGPGQYPEHDW